VVFVPRALPGEAGLIRLSDTRRDFARGELEQLERAAPGRVEAPCPYYSVGCGGCSWQHAEYSLQLRLKEQIVVEQLRRIGHFGDASELVRPAIGRSRPWRYRNRSRFTVGRAMATVLHLPLDASPRVSTTAGSSSHQRTAQDSAGTWARWDDASTISIPAGERSEYLISLLQVPGSRQPEWMQGGALGRRFRLEPPSFFQVNTRREQRALPRRFAPRCCRYPADGVNCGRAAGAAGLVGSVAF
jgi:hypothetical protein